MREHFDNVNHYLTPDTRSKLAKDCEITEDQVTNWFNNQRSRTNNTRPAKRTAATSAAASHGQQLQLATGQSELQLTAADQSQLHVNAAHAALFLRQPLPPPAHQLWAPSAQAHAHAQMLAAAQITQAQSQQLAQVHAARGLQHPVALQPQAVIPVQPLSEAERTQLEHLSRCLTRFGSLTPTEMAQFQFLRFRREHFLVRPLLPPPPSPLPPPPPLP